jgi:hypothetical protein
MKNYDVSECGVGTINTTSEKKFEEIVRAMSAKEIIMAMVDALTIPPIINIDMGTFGRVRTFPKYKFLGIGFGKKEICFGCAATNTVCKIADKKFDTNNIEGCIARAEFINSDPYFLSCFENAIDGLRTGSIHYYNKFAGRGEFVVIKNTGLKLYPLANNYTNEHLIYYKLLAEQQ